MDEFSLLRLQIEWGADEALEDAPVVRLRAPDAVPVRTMVGRPVRPGPRAEPSATSAGSPAERALTVVAKAGTLDALNAAVSGFDGCPLRGTATNTILAVGGADAPCVVIGDPPNADDDRSGQAFSGTDGQLLDMMLSSAGLARERLLLVPLLPWRPPGGRPANASELATCLPFLHRLIVLVRPRFLVIAGSQALRAMIGTRPRAQGGLRVAECRIPGMPEPIDAILLPFPATALRTAAARKEAWAAMRRIRRTLDADP